jgi:hypothetical protein
VRHDFLLKPKNQTIHHEILRMSAEKKKIQLRKNNKIEKKREE